MERAAPWSIESNVALANRLRIATMYNIREYVVAGGLISYAPSLTEVYRQMGTYVAKVLKGAKS